VPDGIAVGERVLATARGLAAFYDIDTPVTLAALEAGACAYLAAGQIRRYGLYLSFTGGPTLRMLESRYGAPMARALYCSVDAVLYRPAELPTRWHLGYLGTYSADRQQALERLLIEPARRAPNLRFVVAGPQYPDTIAWPDNVERIDHLGPDEHVRFYSSLGATLNVTRADMVRAGWSPSVRLFEAAACAVPIISDDWPGLSALFQPGREIVVAERPAVVLDMLGWSEPRRRAIGIGGRRRVLAEHTSRHRAAELEAHLMAAAERRALIASPG
jgi:spore maturation protein CgeB